MLPFEGIQVTPGDLATVGFLIFLEGILSIDNAVVLALLASRLPKHLQRKALTYGILGAIIFRLLALGMVAQLMQWNWVKFVGGGYLLFVAIKHWLWDSREKKDDEAEGKKGKKEHLEFWKVVLLIELTDIAFAVDSILAAVALSPKFWVVFTGGVLGLVTMRFAATGFIKLLERFPRFETSAYLLVALIGSKLVIDGFKFEAINFHSKTSPASWAFWALMALAVAYGFKPKRPSKAMRKKLAEEVKVIEKIEGHD